MAKNRKRGIKILYIINFNALDEKSQKDLKKLLENYYSGLIYDDESLQRYVESAKTKKEEISRDKNKIKVFEIFGKQRK